MSSVADALDEEKWGLDWLLKMHPRPDWMFNQIADDRDHRGFRLPTLIEQLKRKGHCFVRIDELLKE